MIVKVTNIEERWLKYAREVLHGPDPNSSIARPEVCCRNHCDHRIRRWPGYLGAKYKQRGGIMLVGAIHNETDFFTELAGAPRKIDVLQDTVRKWLAGKLTDAMYLSEVRATYEHDSEQWGGTVWRNFHKILGGPRKFDIELRHVAFTNLAKCFLPAGSKSYRNLVLTCMDKHPLMKLVEVLDPKHLFIASADAKVCDRLGGLYDGKRKIWQFVNAGPDHGKLLRIGRPISEWPEMPDWMDEATDACDPKMR